MIMNYCLILWLLLLRQMYLRDMAMLHEAQPDLLRCRGAMAEQLELLGSMLVTLEDVKKR